ncbi:MAG: hypothetical protein HFJ58_00460 [Clostridia bacterium]|nr:hypothetical protein [Clostridia bacterium]
MGRLEKDEIKKNIYSRDWKEKNDEYLKALERFFDITDNIEDENLRMDIIYKMLKCDEVLTKLAENTFKSNA